MILEKVYKMGFRLNNNFIGYDIDSRNRFHEFRCKKYKFSDSELQTTCMEFIHIRNVMNGHIDAESEKFVLYSHSPSFRRVIVITHRDSYDTESK